MMKAGAIWGVDKKVVVEGGDIEEDGLVVEEEFCEEGEILGEKLGNEGQRQLGWVRKSQGQTWCSSPSSS